MANTQRSEETRILHFFETASIEKAEAVFNIVADKLRERAPNSPAAPRDQRSKKTVGPEPPTRQTSPQA